MTILSDAHGRQLMAAMEEWVVATYARDAEALARADEALGRAYKSIGFKMDETPARLAGVAAMTKYSVRMSAALSILRQALDG